MQRSLRGIRILTELPPAVLSDLARRCAWRTYEPGRELISYRDLSSDVYFVVSGTAEVRIYSIEGKVVDFRQIRDGDAVGEFAAIDGQPRSACVEATAPCLVAVLPGAEFVKLLKSEASVTYQLLCQLIARNRRLTERTFELSILTVKNRIHAEVLRLVRDGTVSGNTAVIARAPTHENLASRVATNRESVTRELRHLTGLGLVRREGRTLIVTDVARLERMVHHLV